MGKHISNHYIPIRYCKDFNYTNIYWLSFALEKSTPVFNIVYLKVASASHSSFISHPFPSGSLILLHTSFSVLRIVYVHPPHGHSGLSQANPFVWGDVNLPFLPTNCRSLDFILQISVIYLIL